MRRWTSPVTSFALVLGAVLLGTPASTGDDGNWPSFRGPGAGGVAEGHATPVAWNVERGENLLWKTAIPGLGHGAPVVWGDKVFVATAVGPGRDPQLKVGLYGNIEPVENEGVHRWKLFCLDKTTGKVLWERTAHEGVPAIRRHTKASHANSTPATDGAHVVAFFGSEGLYCYDTNGKLLWKKDLGLLDSGYFKVPEAQWGFGSSPVIHGDRVIVQCDVQTGSFVAALSLRDGKVLWKTARNEVPTWSSPTVVVTEGRSQVVTNGYRHIGGYDLATGKELWKMRGGGDIPVPTPVFAHDLIFITNAHGGEAPVYAIRPDAVGDISLKEGATANEYIAWSAPKWASYMQTPLVYGDHLYVCRDNGVLTVFDAGTGARLGQLRLGGGTTGFTASAVAADGKLYYTSEVGDVLVLAAGAQPKVLAANELGEICMATPAISEGVLFFRTKGHLVAVGSRVERQAPS
jgi:outer membrane protein assembly factor BamB